MALFLKSRRAALLLLWLLAAAAAGRLLGPRGYLLGEQVQIAVPWVAFLPLISAYAVSGSVVSPLPALEMLARRSMVHITWCYLLAASLLAAGLLWWATVALPPPLSTPAAVRDFLGLVGVSLVAIGHLGVSVAWTVPSGAMFLAIVLRGSQVSFPPVDWLLAPDDSLAALVVALSLLLVGVAVTWSRRFRMRNAAD